MKRHNTLMLLTGMTLFGYALAFGQTVAPVASIPDLSGIWVAIGSFLNRRYLVPVRSRASFGGRTGP